MISSAAEGRRPFFGNPRRQAGGDAHPHSVVAEPHCGTIVLNQNTDLLEMIGFTGSLPITDAMNARIGAEWVAMCDRSDRDLVAVAEGVQEC
jgi:hypothetical protein